MPAIRYIDPLLYITPPPVTLIFRAPMQGTHIQRSLAQPTPLAVSVDGFFGVAVITKRPAFRRFMAVA